jgi:hypothetical protein
MSLSRAAGMPMSCRRPKWDLMRDFNEVPGSARLRKYIGADAIAAVSWLGGDCLLSVSPLTVNRPPQRCNQALRFGRSDLFRDGRYPRSPK